MIQNLVEVDDISEAEYITIGKKLRGITVGKLYKLVYDTAIGWTPESGVKEKWIVNDLGQPMSLMGVTGFLNCKFYK